MLRTDFDRSVGYLVTALANKLTTGSSRRLKRRLNVGLMEWRVIALLGAETEASPARIAQVAGVDKSVVSRAVTTLDRSGLIVINPGPQAGRQTTLRLTPAGQALHDKGIVDTVARDEGLLKGFSEAERDTLVALLKRLNANVADLHRD